MMEHFEQFKTFLPAYLCAESYKKILEELKNFPDNIDGRFYSQFVQEKDPIQGDGVAELPCIALPSQNIKQAPCIVLSNSCDISRENKRKFPVNVLYSPILRLSKFERMLRSLPDITNDQIDMTLEDIRKQRVSNIIYLPPFGDGAEEGLVLLDRICSCDLGHALGAEERPYLFRLSNYGFYVFLMKIAIHFTRMQEGIDRC